MAASRLSIVFALASAAFTIAACGTSDDDTLEEIGAAVTEAVPVGTELRTTSDVSFRDGPTTSSRRIRTLARGTLVVVVASEPVSGFYRVRHEGTEGWVYGQYLQSASGGPGDPEEGFAHSRNVRIVYQGSCDFLHRCDRFSRNLPEGQVSWGCLGRPAACVDSDHWLSGPSRDYCGKTVKICKGSTCTTGKVMDVSVSRSFEASQGVLDAIGIGYGGGSTCSNTFLSGDPNVTVYW